jgi:rubrerythrin
MDIKQEQKNTLEAVKFSIQMEIDGKKYYLEASRRSTNKAGKELFQWLAAEEDKHRRIFAGIFDAIRKQKAWPEVRLAAGKGIKLETLFSKEMRAMQPDDKGKDGEIESISGAMEMENKTREFYISRHKQAAYDGEKKLYTALAAEEEGHYLALVDYREYLIDPAGYFRKAEHHSLDGG